MKKPLVSVIIPIYNVEKYIDKTINSVLSQTYSNIEIILINDGSTDNSLEICKKYKKMDSRIIIIDKENGGLSSARNAGLDVAKGEYISLIDGDDFIEVHFIEYLLDLIIKNKADIAECYLERVDEKELGNTILTFNNNQNDILVLNNLDALKRIHNDDFDICLRSVVVWNKLYRKDLFNNIRYPEGKIHEDEFTTYKLFYCSRKIVFSNEKLYGYVQRNNSIMKQNFKINRLDALDAYDNYLNFFMEKKLYDMQARTCMRYLRLLTIIQQEVISSNYENKKGILEILNNKFYEIKSFLEELLKNHKELEYRKENHKVFIQLFNKNKQ